MALSEKLQEYGVTESNIVKALAAYVFVGYSYTWFMFGFCYYFKPIQKLSRIFNTNKIYIMMEKSCLNENTIKETSYYYHIKNNPKKLELSMAFADQIALKSLIFPVTIPLRLWLTIKIVKFWNKITKPTTEASNNLKEELKTEESMPIGEVFTKEQEFKSE
ncbi:unnamed protein product [Blepharisma stoltei]|uniref:Transmembrane protein n=1 Tax=Blepharisma stoltei TaxID=1481888 RepID=A0AAU9KCQ1_9CILI|nr:unnamed protein product [Blepharisma stoltei]